MRNFPCIRILADDLSGAADCAASFSGATGPLPLHLGAAGAAPREARAVDCDTRAVGEREAMETFRNAALREAEAVRAGEARLYKKIDSTLRGHVGAELRAMLEALAFVDRVVVAPAFPQQGRGLKGGQLVVHGETRTAWRGGLAGLLSDATGERAVAIQAGELRRALQAPVRGSRIRVVDAASDAELCEIADAVRESDGRTLLVGSSGLARAVAGVAPRRVEAASLPSPVLTVVGAFGVTAARQVGTFRESMRAAAHVASFTPEDPAWAEPIAGALERGRDALVHLPFAESPPTAGVRAHVRRLAAALTPALSRCATLVVTGGDTARAVLEEMRIAVLRVEGEIEPGIAVARPVGRETPMVAIKAGGFGDNRTLVRLVSR